MRDKMLYNWFKTHDLNMFRRCANIGTGTCIHALHWTLHCISRFRIRFKFSHCPFSHQCFSSTQRIARDQCKIFLYSNRGKICLDQTPGFPKFVVSYVKAIWKSYSIWDLRCICVFQGCIRFSLPPPPKPPPWLLPQGFCNWFDKKVSSLSRWTGHPESR